MFKNLEAEMVRRNVKRNDLAIRIGVRYQAICLKLNGKSPITFNEATTIRDEFFPDKTLEELFEEIAKTA